MTAFPYQLKFAVAPSGLSLAGQCSSRDPAGDAKPLLIALHGWLDNSMSFAPLAPYLADFSLLALDLPGHGHSEHIGKGGTYPFLDGVVLIHEFLDQHIKRPYYLLGHSLGACMATLVASLKPTNLKSLLLIDGLLPLTQPEDGIVVQLQHHIARLRKYEPERKVHYPSLEIPTAQRALKGELSKASARLIVERNLRHEDQGYSWRFDRRLRLPATHRLTDAHAEAFLKAIDVPTLLIIGEDSEYPILKHAGARIELLKNLTLEKFPGSHHLHMDTPEPVAKALCAFLARVLT